MVGLMNDWIVELMVFGLMVCWLDDPIDLIVAESN